MAETYTIQFRRGMYADFDTSKIRPGEPVAILGNDPSVPSGKALYIAFAANDVRRLCSIEDISEMVNAGEFVGPQGPKGEKGDPGEKGADGTVAFESLTPEQKESLRGISIKSASIDTDGNLTITFSDGDSEDVGNIMGPQGIPGPKGDKGDVGPRGPKGDKGDVGPKGDNMSDEQAAQIEQNKKDVALLKEDLSNKITKFYASSQGEPHLADSDNGQIMDMMVYGKSKQKQYSGKNLFKATLGNVTVNGITCTANSDGTYILNGTCTVDTSFSKIGIFDHILNEPLYLTGVPSGCGSYLALVRYDGNNILVTNGGNTKIDAGIHTKHIEFWITKGTTLNNVIFKPMITTDLTATYDDFEPYTGGIPSPNPDYPQEIKSVVNPTVKVCGKNLLEDGSLKSDNNGKIEYISAGKIKVTSSISTWYAAITNTLKLTPNTNYVLSAKCDSSNGNITCNSVSVTGAYIKCAFLTDSDGLATIAIRCRYESAESRFVYSDLQLEKGSTATAYEPYTEQTVALPYTLNAIPVSSGGNVTIDGQQYMSDYVDVERGKLVRMCKHQKLFDMNINDWGSGGNGARHDWFVNVEKYDNTIFVNRIIPCLVSSLKRRKSGVSYPYFAYETTKNNGWMGYSRLAIYVSKEYDTLDKLKEYVGVDTEVVYQLKTPEETDLTPEEIAAFKSLATYYPTTNISVNSEQLDGYTVFNYPISMKNGWNYVKQQIGDTRNYIYDMDARTQDTDLQAAEAYVNSEYAVALTELEV